MRLASVSEAFELDRRSQTEGALSSEILMEAVGALVAREIRAWIRNQKLRLKRQGYLAVVCGPGGNGADGLVVARHLASAGFRVRSYLVQPESSHPLFRLQLARLPDSVGRHTLAQKDELLDAEVIIDAIFGLGLSRNVSGECQSWIETINQAEGEVVSLDVPSGLDADEGGLRGLAIKADLTLTFTLAKPGFFVNHGPVHVGQLKVLPIGIDRRYFASSAKTLSAFGPKAARRLLPKRAPMSNKSNHGRVAIFAGESDRRGAAILAGLAAMRMGAGYVEVVLHVVQDSGPLLNEIGQLAPEFLTFSASDPALWQKLKSSVAVVGPAFGVGGTTLEVLRQLHQANQKTVVVDADALTVLAQEHTAGRALPLNPNWILTPHAGELSRLIGVEAQALEAKRFESARQAARELGAIVLLKGYRTVVSDGVRSTVILSGNAGLAKAGSGDTLSGFIGALLAQRLDPFDAACLGAYIHGKLADEWLESGLDILALLPSDLLQNLPALLRSMRAAR